MRKDRKDKGHMGGMRTTEGTRDPCTGLNSGRREEVKGMRDGSHFRGQKARSGVSCPGRGKNSVWWFRILREGVMVEGKTLETMRNDGFAGNISKAQVGLTQRRKLSSSSAT